ncbi:MAG: ABC transporter ATP-binding protein [Clostridiales bacterium]|nr:ABC transporter ATP-binding protein [Clostridiales bacterium]
MSIVVKNLNFSYGNRKIIEDVSFTAEEGELLVILGPNGVGKSTLFQCILGLLPGYTGTITVNGDNARNIGIRELARRMAYIPQIHSPVFNYTVFDIVLMGTASQISEIGIPGKEHIRLAEEAIERLEIGHLRDRAYTQISGGERQLVMIARALAQKAKILVMDEPTSNLDYGNQIRILSHIKSLVKQGYTIIQSSHNPDQAFLFSDKVLALLEGRVLAYGSPKDVISGDVIKQLYSIDVEVENLHNGKVRIFLPSALVNH